MTEKDEARPAAKQSERSLYATHQSNHGADTPSSVDGDDGHGGC